MSSVTSLGTPAPAYAGNPTQTAAASDTVFKCFQYPQADRGLCHGKGMDISHTGNYGQIVC